jgi:hypothetical protein
MTSCPTSAKHAPVTSPTYSDPTIEISIRSNEKNACEAPLDLLLDNDLAKALGPDYAEAGGPTRAPGTLRLIGCPGNSQGFFYEIRGDRKSVGLGNYFL